MKSRSRGELVSLSAFLLVSLIVHFTITFLIPRTKLRPPSPEKIFTVDLAAGRSERPTADPGHPRARTSKQSGQRDSLQTPAASSLSPSFSPHFDRDHELTKGASPQMNELDSSPMEAVGPTGQGWSAAVQFMNAMNLETTNATLGFYESLHRRIESRLVYPNDFARQRIEGRVRVEAEVDRDGRFVKFLSSTTDDRILQTYCFVFLLQSLNQPIPERFWLKSGHAAIAFDFQFKIRIEGSPSWELTSGIEKNRLYFGREASVDPWLNEKIHEVFTHYVPPIVPLPGGFYIDFVLAYEYVQNLVDPKPTESEARRARIDALHQSLLSTIKESKSKPSTSSALPES